jgi:hypothetical protein
MDEFRKGATRVLITTDVWARGLDVQQVRCLFGCGGGQGRRATPGRRGLGRGSASGLGPASCRTMLAGSLGTRCLLSAETHGLWQGTRSTPLLRQTVR